MANATTSYSDWARANPAVVNQAVAAQAPMPAVAATPAPAPIKNPYQGAGPAFDADEYAKAQQSDAKNDAIAAGEDPNKPKNNNAMGKVLGLVGTFFGGPIGAVLGAAGGMVGGDNEAEDPAKGGDGGAARRSSTAQNYLSSFVK